MMIRIGFQRSAHHFVRSILRSDQQQQTFPSLFSWHRPQTYRETPQFRFRQPFATRRNISSQKEGDDWITASTAVSAQVHDSYDVAWNNRYKELIKYIEDNGSAMVPRGYEANPVLSNWVRQQRLKYKNNQLSPERIQKLNEIEFPWNGKEAIRLEQYEPQWMDRFHELLKYIEEHGNALVPCKYTENPQLGVWVVKQRQQYKNSELPSERIQKLSEIGFVWDPLELQWFERFEELKEYRRNHGDTLVPHKYPSNPALSFWVKRQRQDYKKFMTKKKLEADGALQHELEASEVEKFMNIDRRMTVERIRLLEAEDFVWNVYDHAWQLKYDELCEWIALNGHGGIPGNKSDPLENWVFVQRKMYKKYLNGEKIGLPKETIEERIKRLERVGFVFELETTIQSPETRKKGFFKIINSLNK